MVESHEPEPSSQSSTSTPSPQELQTPSLHEEHCIVPSIAAEQPNLEQVNVSRSSIYPSQNSHLEQSQQ